MSQLPPFDPADPENAGVLRWLCRDGATPLRSPATRAAYLHAGSHPDVVEQVWDRLGEALPARSRCLVAGTPALVHPATGVILATALGTSYALRLPAARLPTALLPTAKLTTRHTYTTVGITLDLREFGPCWRFGAYGADEPQWCVEAAAGLEARRKSS